MKKAQKWPEDRRNRRPRRVPRVPKAVMAEEKEENGSRETAEPKTEEKRKAAPARGRQQGTKRSFPAVKEAGEKRAPLRKPTRNSQKEAKSKLKIIPLGGLRADWYEHYCIWNTKIPLLL